MTRIKLSILVVGLVLVASSTVAAIAVTNGNQRVARFGKVSNGGTAVASADIASQDADVLESGGGTTALRLLGQRDSIAFYSSMGKAGGLCHATATASGHIASLFCPASGSSEFPSEKTPILDMSGVAYDPTTHVTRLLDLTGFAADGIARVGVLSTDGSLHATPVVANVYHGDLPDVQAAALVAFDETGAEVYHHLYFR